LREAENLMAQASTNINRFEEAFSNGKKYLEANKWEKAIEQYRAINKLDPDSLNSLLKIGEIFVLMDKFVIDEIVVSNKISQSGHLNISIFQKEDMPLPGVPIEKVYLLLAQKQQR